MKCLNLRCNWYYIGYQCVLLRCRLLHFTEVYLSHYHYFVKIIFPLYVKIYNLNSDNSNWFIIITFSFHFRLCSKKIEIKVFAQPTRIKYGLESQTMNIHILQSWLRHWCIRTSASQREHDAYHHREDRAHRYVGVCMSTIQYAQTDCLSGGQNNSHTHTREQLNALGAQLLGLGGSPTRTFAALHKITIIITQIIMGAHTHTDNGVHAYAQLGAHDQRILATVGVQTVHLVRLLRQRRLQIQVRAEVAVLVHLQGGIVQLPNAGTMRSRRNVYWVIYRSFQFTQFPT